ncbi:MAG: TAXI family TRAP transporter solute-binding subunit [Planctomycetota bacterium]|jgi:TRAP transporter TAXI family solute receptor
MTRKWIRIAGVAGLILLPFAVRWVYLWATAHPKTIVIATGKQHGRYHDLGLALAERIRAELDVVVEVRSTTGSLENLRLLREGKVDFGFYQPGTREAFLEYGSILGGDVATASNRAAQSDVAFVANLYSQPAHCLVRPEAGIQTAAGMKGKRVCLGLPNSGDLAMSLVVLDHVGLDPRTDIDARTDLDYRQIERAFREGDVDAAIISAGVQAKVYQELAREGRCRIVEIPNVEALVRNNLYLSAYTIPRGFYCCDAPVPDGDVNTVAAAAQLLVGADVPSRLVQAVAGCVHNRHFIKDNHLRELYDGGSEFALLRPEYPVHPGARAYYEPRLKPLLDPDLVESTEGTISLACSLVIALFVLVRWLRDRRAKRKEHKLDRCIHALLDIERRQMPLEDVDTADDVPQLQALLDEVTVLRQEALSEFTAHQLNEDRGPECFIQMCHALSNKINAKLSRRQQQRLVRELIEVVNASRAENA